jgi:Zn-finger nucleic acid-binding protein
MHGTIGSLHYSTIASNDAKLLIYRVELPFSTKVHLLSIPKTEGVIQLVPDNGNSLLEKVNLEGDFSSYFSIFAERNQQVDARYILDPKAMLFTIDFCKSHNWELINNELYFLQSTSTTTGDPTDMFNDILPFIEEIKPAVSRPLTAIEIRNATPYGQDRRQDLQCPICASTMQNKKTYFICPKQHGILLPGKELAALRKGQKITIAATTPHPNTEEQLKCPSCGEQLEKVSYNGKYHVIDSCSHCPYRWLDAAEVVAFQNTEKLDFDIDSYM